jgi:hypothetical protein
MNYFLLAFLLNTIAGFVFANEIENKLFDENRTTAIDLLEKEYQQSKVLFIGFYHHYTHQHIDQLSSLLQKIGNDPNFKTIVLERSSDVSSFYELLSTKELSTAIDDFGFSSQQAQEQTLCRGPGEWSYVIKNFFPELRKINQRRSDNPILAKSVDGIQTHMVEEDWPGLNRPMIDGTCPSKLLTTRSGETLTIYGISSTREQTTANSFKSQIWDKLGPNDKAIVLYHRAHLTDGLEVCQPEMISENNWTANLGNFSWYGRFLSDNPEVKKDVSLIFIDEKFDQKNEMITFDFTKRQSERSATDWAISLRPFKNVMNEIGFQMFTKESDIRRLFSNRYSSGSKTLPEIANGLIFNSEAHIRFQNLKSSDYLPEYCPRQ